MQFTWYWLADLCQQEGIEFVLGLALYMKAIHGGKAKNDKIDAFKIATLRRGNLLAHIQNTHHQYNLAPPKAKIACKANREGVAEAFGDPDARKSMEVDFTLIEHYDSLIRDLELHLERRAKQHGPQAYHRLRSVPGIGKILALTILYEIHDIGRFDRVQDSLSYTRLVKCDHSSAGKKLGTGGAKIGNVHLKWAFSEAAAKPRRSRSWPPSWGGPSISCCARSEPST